MLALPSTPWTPAASQTPENSISDCVLLTLPFQACQPLLFFLSRAQCKWTEKSPVPLARKRSLRHLCFNSPSSPHHPSVFFCHFCKKKKGIRGSRSAIPTINSELTHSLFSFPPPSSFLFNSPFLYLLLPFGACGLLSFF